MRSAHEDEGREEEKLRKKKRNKKKTKKETKQEKSLLQSNERLSPVWRMIEREEK